jgi:hypothetical protein
MADVKKCVFCKTEVYKSNPDSGWILCSMCVATLMEHRPVKYSTDPIRVTRTEDVSPHPRRVKKQRVVAKKPAGTPTGFGRGWHLKKHFVAPDGTEYSLGKKITTS